MKHTPIINEIVNEVQTKQQDECIRDAAPELLAALEALLPWAERYYPFSREHAGLESDLQAARAAIAKAKGEA